MNSRKLRVFKKGIAGVVRKDSKHDHVQFFSKKLKCQGQLLTVLSAPVWKKMSIGKCVQIVTPLSWLTRYLQMSNKVASQWSR